MRSQIKGYTLRQAAKKLGITPQGVHKAIKSGRLKARTQKIHKQVWVISPEDLKAYVVSLSHKKRGQKKQLTG
jgi:predicted DNA-binding protein (UPF0251 family)